MVALLGVSVVLGAPGAGAQSGGSAGAKQETLASTAAQPTVRALVAATVESIKGKQQNAIDETCDALEAVAEVMDPGALQHQQAQCAVARRTAEAVTTEEIMAVAIKRGATATAFAEYTGPNRDEPPGGGGDDPTWNPGQPTLEDVGYLGNQYAFDGDGDGVCMPRNQNEPPTVEAGGPGHGHKLTDYTEWCAEAIGDGVGDDDGFCERQNPAGKDKAFDERCVTVELTFDSITADDENLDLERLVDYEQLLGQAETTAQQFRRATKDAVALLANEPPVVATAGGRTCPANQDRLKEQGIALGIVTGLAVGLEGTANTIGAFNDQTVVAAGFGGNTSSAKSVLYAAAAAAHVTATALEVTADIDTATNVTNTLECLSAFREESNAAINELSEDVAALSQVTLQVLELKEKSTYLVTATVSGRPLSGVRLTSVRASVPSPIQFIGLATGALRFAEVTGAPGTYELNVSLPPSLSNASLFLFDVEYEAADGPIFGHVLFD